MNKKRTGNTPLTVLRTPTQKAADELFVSLFQQFKDQILAVKSAELHVRTAKEMAEVARDQGDQGRAFYHDLAGDGAEQHRRFVTERLGQVVYDFFKNHDTPTVEH